MVTRKDFPNEITAKCPCCNQMGDFMLLGIQEWDADAAADADLPPIMALYTCPNCDTTISHLSLVAEQY